MVEAFGIALGLAGLGAFAYLSVRYVVDMVIEHYSFPKDFNLNLKIENVYPEVVIDKETQDYIDEQNDLIYTVTDTYANMSDIVNDILEGGE